MAGQLCAGCDHPVEYHNTSRRPARCNVRSLADGECQCKGYATVKQEPGNDQLETTRASEPLERR